jgi:hypothetical protein
MLDNLSCEDYAQHLNTKFRLRIGDERVTEIEMVEAKDNSPSPRQEQFVLLFRAPGDTPPNQGTYRLQRSAFIEFQFTSQQQCYKETPWLNHSFQKSESCLSASLYKAGRCATGNCSLSIRIKLCFRCLELLTVGTGTICR